MNDSADLAEPYDPEAPPALLELIPGAWYLARDVGEALGPFDTIGEGTEASGLLAALGGRLLLGDTARLEQLHMHPFAGVELSEALCLGMLETALRFGYRSLEHRIARRAANDRQIAIHHERVVIAKENAVCVNRRREAGDMERRRQAAEKARAIPTSASSVEPDGPAPSLSPATTPGELPPSGDTASPASKPRPTKQGKPMRGSSPASFPASWKRPAPSATPSPGCATIPTGGSLAGSPGGSAQRSLFAAHELAPLHKPEPKARRKRSA